MEDLLSVSAFLSKFPISASDSKEFYIFILQKNHVNIWIPDYGIFFIRLTKNCILSLFHNFEDRLN